jgi:hypothetical protein
MGGYVPLFDSLTKGTLCGRWPDIGLWPIVLSMGDKNGVVDVTPQFIAGVTGLPVDEVIACLSRFCQPDPCSRSPEANGARLILLDSHREWGWQIVNHRSYREKARKQMQQIVATESGRDAERKRIERESAQSGAVQSCPAQSGADRPSDSDSDSDSDSENPPLPPKGDSVTGLDPAAWDRFAAYRRQIRKPIKPASVQAAQRKLAGFGEDQADVVEQSIANSWTGLFAPKDDMKKVNGAHQRKVIP